MRRHCLSWCLLCGSLFLLSLSHTTSFAKEVEITEEWTLLGENDTLPAGAHIRMDLTTGEKWAKLVDEEEEDQEASTSSMVHTSGVVSSAVSVDSTNDDETEAGPPPQHADKRTDPDYDFDMMHRTFSKLPPDELERMGGLPELPSSSGSKMNIVEREAYEARMKEIWTQRQAELQGIQEDSVADLPLILKNRIKSLQDYLGNPSSHLALLELESTSDPDEEVVSDVISVLKDLEYQLSDMDMARDFYTLGGWPLLVMLLSDSVHFVNQTCDEELRSKVHTIQTHACWAIGTMVKNAEEFYPFAVEEVSIIGKNMTALSLLVNWFGTTGTDDPEPRKQKAMYALGALLRGNRLAQDHFIGINGPDQLVRSLTQFYEEGSTSSKVAKRILALADDVVSDVFLHSGFNAQVDKDIVEAFSTESWCNSVMRVLSGSDDLQETALKTFQTLAPHCQWDHEMARKSIKFIETMWSSEEEMDPDHLTERLLLVETALEAMEKANQKKR